MAYVGLIWDGKLDEAHGGGGPDDHVRTLICSWSSGPPPPCASLKPGVCNNQVCVLIRSVCKAGVCTNRDCVLTGNVY